MWAPVSLWLPCIRASNSAMRTRITASSLRAAASCASRRITSSTSALGCCRVGAGRHARVPLTRVTGERLTTIPTVQGVDPTCSRNGVQAELAVPSA